MSSLDKPPKVLVSASATGYYGDRPGEVITESPPPSSSSSALPTIDFLYMFAEIGKKLIKLPKCMVSE
jgi:NAD dependent epimerase/dehydratase family enzyme